VVTLNQVVDKTQQFDQFDDHWKALEKLCFSGKKAV
jgi:hypothetical protein